MTQTISQRRTMQLEIATIATSVPMGAQVYQEAVSSRAAEALSSVTDVPWAVSRVIARSLRSELEGTRRIPVGALSRIGPTSRRFAGRLLYSRDALVHRMDLTLPPAPNEVVTIHDTVAWTYPDEGIPNPAVVDEIRRARAVVCVSTNTAGDVFDLTGRSDLKVVSPGVDGRFFSPPPLTTIQRADLGLSQPYVLHAGGASARKNLEGLAEAWELVQSAFPDVSLAMSGPPHERRDALFADLPRVVRLGRVDDDVVPRLLASAEAVVVPSHYEGFGLPVIEAMAAGVPVIAARTSSLPEAAGDAAVLVETGAASIAEGIESVLRGGSAVSELREKGARRALSFTWDESVRALAQVWAEAAR
ncbi:glycosyltransferase family 1 protein [Microbacterium sp. MPKO10]|uniref:glycosyltransferase family 4 protein n=1 Tax=Microbacterium sp. MPKO10 TaxID=2989818 RepID=UPI002235EDD7|nr:glycosyltransferase family 1 protein [Microbacterium sp. MPKO10]MCW4458875.1 glycosyltransferase family 4 protein [Microbacterium sp. MPKO10]